MNPSESRVPAAIRLFFPTVCALVSTALAQTVPPVVYNADSFDPAGTHGFSYTGGKIGSVWSNWFGAAFQSLSWDSATDANANAGSGSLKIISNFPGSGNNQFAVLNGFSGISPSVSARQFTAFECDVKFAPGSATVLKNGVPTFGHLEFGMATPSYGQLYFGAVDVPASNTGWFHVSIPLNPATNANLYKISNVLIHIWGGTSLSGSSTLWVDNIKFTGSTVTDTATVNYATVRQQIDGFGASSAWGSTWSAAEADLFFSTGANGVGLSLLRTRIAPDGSTVEAGLAQMAQARGARVWSTPWSPPSNLKTSNSWVGGSFISSPANYQAYANQLATYVSSMKTNYGVNLHAVSIQNEPNYETTYESCLWSAAQFHEFVPYLSAALTARGVGSTKIMLPECAQWNFALAADTMNDPATAAQVGILGGHNYGSSAGPVTQFGSPPPVPLWETENYFGTGSDIVNGLAVAEEIHNFMTVAEASAYHYWWLKGSGTGSIAGNSTTSPAKRLYVMGNYSKFVRPGFQRIGVSSDTTALISAYKDPASQKYVIVAANPTAWPITQTFNLASCPAVTTMDRWVTSSTLSLSSQAAVNVAAGSFTAELPAYTVTTYVSVAGASPVILLKTDDAFGASSFASVGNWNDTIAPNPAKDYSTAQFALRTPSGAGSQTFNGHSLTVAAAGALRFKGANNAVITIANLTLDGGLIENGNANTSFTLAGNLAVNSNSTINLSNDATRGVIIAADLSGSGALSNGNGGPGSVTYTGNNDSFTGPINVNGGTILKVGSLSNLGGNPATFNPAQFSLDNGVFQPTAGFEMNRTNSGVTLGTGGGTFNLTTGLTLTVSNPIVGAGNLTKTGAGTLAITTPSAHLGSTAVSAGRLAIKGISGPGSVTVASGAYLTGSGTVAGAATVNGALTAAPAGISFNAGLSVGATGKIKCDLSGNQLLSAGNVTAATVAVTSGAQIEVVLNSPGSTTNLLHSFWRSTRIFPVVTTSSMTGSFGLGAISTDAGGRPVAIYGSFTLQNSGTGVNLVWTPIPGFPVIDEPSIALTNPVGDVVSIVNAGLSLRVSANVAGGAGTAVTWSQVSGSGTAVFSNPAASDTWVTFSADGSYVLRCTVSNEVGTVSKDFTVLVAPSSSITFSEGVNGYAHAATFIRGDNVGMNSGARDQMIVGRNGGALRGLISFDISDIPDGATVTSVNLDLWSAAAGSGNPLGALELHKLLTPFIEGTGDGSNAANGAGTGADWNTRTGNAADPWTTPGAASGTDFETASLTTLPGFNPTTAVSGTRFSFPSTPALIAAVNAVSGTTAPLNLLLKAAGDTSGSNVFVRLASDNHPTLAQRPLLTINYALDQAPDVSPGIAPIAQTGVASPLGGSTTNSISSTWSMVSGPGVAVFDNPSNAGTTVNFSQPGNYVLRLAAANVFGETSAILAVSVQDLTPPIITVPSDMVVEAANSSGAVVEFTTSSIDAVSGVRPTVNLPASGSIFPLGLTTVTTTSSDAAGNLSSKTFKVTVQDVTPPTITVPGAITVAATSSAGTLVTFTTSAIDAVSGPRPTVNTPSSGSVFAPGTTTVQVGATDAAGNSSSASFVVTVLPVSPRVTWMEANFTAEDMANPVISGPDASPAGDGLSNLMKYALGLPAKTPSTSGVSLNRTATAWRVTYQRPTDRPDVTYFVEFSSDLSPASWTTSGVTHSRVQTGETETWQAEKIADEGTGGYFRLRVNSP